MQPLYDGDPRQIGGHRVVARLGGGTTALVFLGEDTLGRHTAIKLVQPGPAADPAFRAWFADAVAAARRVGDPCVTPVTDADVTAPQPWYATVFDASPSLETALAAHGPLSEYAQFVLVCGIAQALAACHTAGLHRVAPRAADLLLTPAGPRLTDFAIARNDESGLSPASASAALPAPEDLRGEPAGPPADVFALGALMVLAAGGEGPYGTAPAWELHNRMRSVPPRLDAVPPSLRDLVGACLDPDPARRPAAAQVLAGVLPAGRTLPEMAGQGWLSPEIAALATVVPPPAPAGAAAGPPPRPQAPPSVPPVFPPASPEPAGSAPPASAPPAPPVPPAPPAFVPYAAGEPPAAAATTIAVPPAAPPASEDATIVAPALTADGPGAVADPPASGGGPLIPGADDEHHDAVGDHVPEDAPPTSVLRPAPGPRTAGDEETPAETTSVLRAVRPDTAGDDRPPGDAADDDGPEGSYDLDVTRTSVLRLPARRDPAGTAAEETPGPRTGRAENPGGGPEFAGTPAATAARTVPATGDAAERADGDAAGAGTGDGWGLPDAGRYDGGLRDERPPGQGHRDDRDDRDDRSGGIGDRSGDGPAGAHGRDAAETGAGAGEVPPAEGTHPAVQGTAGTAAASGPWASRPAGTGHDDAEETGHTSVLRAVTARLAEPGPEEPAATTGTPVPGTPGPRAGERPGEGGADAAEPEDSGQTSVLRLPRAVTGPDAAGAEGRGAAPVLPSRGDRLRKTPAGPGAPAGGGRADRDAAGPHGTPREDGGPSGRAGSAGNGAPSGEAGFTGHTGHTGDAGPFAHAGPPAAGPAGPRGSSPGPGSPSGPAEPAAASAPGIGGHREAPDDGPGPLAPPPGPAAGGGGHGAGAGGEAGGEAGGGTRPPGRRRFLAWAAAGAGVLLVGGGATAAVVLRGGDDGDGGEAGPAPDDPPQATGPFTLQVRTQKNTLKPALAADLTAQFRVRQPMGMLDTRTTGFDGLFKATGEPGGPDIFELDVLQVARYAATGRLADLTPYRAKLDVDRCASGYAQAVTVGGRLYGLPLFAAVPVVMYDQALYRAAGVGEPRTMEEWLAGLDRLKAANASNPAFRALYLPGKQWNVLAACVFEQGGEIAVPDGPGWRPGLDRAESLRGVELFRRLQSYAPEAATRTGGSPNAGELFGKGQIASVVGDDGLYDAAIKQTPALKGKVGAFPLPGRAEGRPSAVGLQGSVLVVSARCQNVPAAAEVLRLLADDAWRTRLANDAAATPVRPDLASRFTHANPMLQASVRALAGGRAFPAAPGWTSAPLTDLGQKVLSGTAPQAAATEAGSAIAQRFSTPAE